MWNCFWKVCETGQNPLDVAKPIFIYRQASFSLRHWSGCFQKAFSGPSGYWLSPLEIKTDSRLQLPGGGWISPTASEDEISVSGRGGSEVRMKEVTQKEIDSTYWSSCLQDATTVVCWNHYRTWRRLRKNWRRYAFPSCALSLHARPSPLHDPHSWCLMMKWWNR